MPAWIEEPHRAEVDFLVAGHRVRNRRLVLREGGGVEDDRVVACTDALEAPQLVEHVDLARLEVRDAVADRIRADPLDGVGGNVERLRLGTRAREAQREAAVVAETIEQRPARVARRRLAVLALVEEQPGLLTAPQ